MRRLFKTFFKLIKNMDKGLLFFTTVLAIFGLLSILSASTRESVVGYNLTLYHYFNQHAMMLGIGVFLSILILFTPTKYYKYLIPVAFLIAITLNIATGFGDAIRGNNNWIKILGFQFQPSEIAQPVLIIALAILFERFYKKVRNAKDNSRYTQIAIIIFVAAIFPFLIYFIQGDLGQVLLIAGTTGSMLLVSPLLRVDKARAGVFLLIVVLLAGIVILSTGGLTSSQSSRMKGFWKPCDDYSGDGYQVCNAIIAINNGGLLGKGIGKSQQKFSYIPDPHTDMIFAVIAEENGLITCSFIFLIYLYILNRIFSISSRASTITGKYIAFGFAVYIFVHIFVNLGGMFAIIPLTGVPLPFLSYGGTFTICLLASIAVVQRIYIETKNS